MEEILFNQAPKLIDINRFVDKYDGDIDIDKGTKLVMGDIDDLSSKDVFRKTFKIVH